MTRLEIVLELHSGLTNLAAMSFRGYTLREIEEEWPEAMNALRLVFPKLYDRKGHMIPAYILRRSSLLFLKSLAEEYQVLFLWGLYEESVRLQAIMELRRLESTGSVEVPTNLDTGRWDEIPFNYVKIRRAH